MGVFSKIGKSIKSFVRSDIGKAALLIGGTLLIPGASTALLSGAKTAVGAVKTAYAAGTSMIPKTGLLGLKGRMASAGANMLLGGGSTGGSSAYGGGSTGYSSTAESGLTTYSPEGSSSVQAPGASDYSAFLNESLAMYSYAETQGRKT